MRRRGSTASVARIGVLILAATTTACLSTGCSTLSYYAQSVHGHLTLLTSATPVSDLIADPATPAPLRARLELTQRMRDFAITDLAEPDNASYRRYADLKRSAAVWNVVAAPELSLDLQTWCLLVVGCVGYRGFYDKAAADNFAAELKARGLEVSVYGVPAYSTLGKLPGTWLADPLLSTFINYGEGDLSRLIFHELAHQVVYAPGDTEFNESFATAVEEIGGDRWLEGRAEPRAREDYERSAARRRDFQALTWRYRDALRSIYQSASTDADKRTQKAATMARLHTDYERMKAERWGGYTGYDGWFARANNASFGVLAAYNGLVPNFKRLFEREGFDFRRFYAEVARIARLPKGDRRNALP